MRQTRKRGSSTRIGLRGAMLVAIALFTIMLVPALAAAIVGPTTTPTALSPVNTTAPTLTGAPALGQTLSCSQGVWANSPTSFSYAWLRSGVPIVGQVASTYVVQAADQGHTISCQVTAANGGGSYKISGLATGSYKVSFSSEGDGVNYLPRYYNGKLTEAEATPVSVTAPATTEAVNAELSVGGQISGRVTDAATHAPLANIFVCAEEASPTPVAGGCSFTSANGEYTIVGLSSASYTVDFDSFLSEANYLNQFYNGKSSLGEAQAVGVTAGTTVAGINAELHSADQNGQISGTVTKAAGGGVIEGIQVCAFEASEFTLFDRCTTTDSKGEYTFTGLPAGSFEVTFSGENCQSEPCTTQNYVYQYYKEVGLSGEATLVPVLANEKVTGIDAKMVAGGVIEGRVTSAAGGDPLAKVQVCAEEASSGNGCVETDGNGDYKLEGLPEGSLYIVSFSPYSGDYLNQSVEHVSVKLGETTPGVDAKLLTGGQITGTVSDASTHAPLENVEVCAEGSVEHGGGCASTNSSGGYTISSLPSDSYSVSFEPGEEADYLSQSDSGVSVTAGSTAPNVNAELHAGAQITGTVTDAVTHAGITKIDVCAEPVVAGVTGHCALTATGAASANAGSNALTIPGGNFTLSKVSFDAKAKDLDFFFMFPSAGKVKWSLFFRNADVGFADSLGLSLSANGVAADIGSRQALAEAARKKKSKACKKGTIKHHGKCVHLLVPFGSGSQAVAAGAVEVKVGVSAKAIRALKAGRTLHVSGTFTFQSALGGPAISKAESAVVRQPKKKHAKKHGKGKRH